jgi:hypothetical protein
VAHLIERGEVRTYDMGGSAGTMDIAHGVAESLSLAHATRE